MPLLIAGLVVFLVSHSVAIVAPNWRARRIESIGAGPWKGAYSVVSLAALVMIVWGYGAARGDAVVVWSPPAGMRHVAALLTIVGFVLIAAAYVPRTKIKSAIGHPMTAGVALWALGHLVANGSLRAITLFGAFFAWALITLLVRRARDRAAGTTYPPGNAAQDVKALVAGVVFSLVFALWLHGPLIGVRPFALV